MFSVESELVSLWSLFGDCKGPIHYCLLYIQCFLLFPIILRNSKLFFPGCYSGRDLEVECFQLFLYIIRLWEVFSYSKLLCGLGKKYSEYISTIYIIYVYDIYNICIYIYIYTYRTSLQSHTVKIVQAIKSKFQWISSINSKTKGINLKHLL